MTTPIVPPAVLALAPVSGGTAISGILRNLAARRILSGRAPAAPGSFEHAKPQAAQALLPPQIVACTLIRTAGLAPDCSDRISPDQTECGGVPARLPQCTQCEVPNAVAEIVGGMPLVEARPPASAVPLAFTAMMAERKLFERLGSPAARIGLEFVEAIP